MKLRYLLGTFVLLSLADLFLTLQLFHEEGNSFAELNPVANRLLESHGWRGLSVFKLSTTLLASSLFLLLAPWRPRLVRGVAAFSCLLTGGVVMYSFLLLWFPTIVSPVAAARARALAVEWTELEKTLAWRKQQHAQNQQRVRDFLAGKCSLAEAFDLQLRSDREDVDRLRLLRLYAPGHSEEVASALGFMYLVAYANGHEPARLPFLLRELADGYERCFHRPVPDAWWEHWVTRLGTYNGPES